MSKEEFAQLSDEQKFWYLKGYINAMIDGIAEDMGISKKIVLSWFINRITPIVHQ